MTTIKQRGGTAAQWASANPVLAAREVGVTTDTKVIKIGDGVTAWNSLAEAGSGSYVRPGIIAPAPTGVAATDTANLQGVINLCANGARLYLPSGTYLINAALNIPGSLSIEGDSVIGTYKASSLGGSTSTPFTPYLAGTIIRQTVAATDILQCFASAATVNLKRIGLQFATGLASTGHGINASPSLVVAAGHDMGLTDFHWQEVSVQGHDGDHYAYVLLNPQIGSTLHCRSYGGGGILTISDAGTINSGNMVHTLLYVSKTKVGTAAGIAHSAAVANGAPGQLNFITYIRPQSNMSNGSTTELTWNDRVGAADPLYITVIDPDLEGMTASSNLPVFGTGTQVLGSPYMDGDSTRFTRGVALGANAAGSSAMTGGTHVAIGYQALAAKTTGSKNTAIGYQALNKVTTAIQSTAIGYQALLYHTGQQNTAVGSGAMTGVNGTSTGTNNTCVGRVALFALTTATNNTAIGDSSLNSITTGSNNVGVGMSSGNYTNGSLANATVAGAQNTFVGFQAGSYSGDINNGTAIGYNSWVAGTGTAIGSKTQAQAAGSVAIGIDSSSGGAVATVTNSIVLGTANHQVQLKNNTTGAVSAALGANCPATTGTAPFTWFKMLSSDGSTVYVPCWK